MNVIDRRRLLGPAGAVPVLFEASDVAPRSLDHRDFFLQTGVVQNVNGSAVLESNGLTVEVSIFGPRPIRGSFIDKASLSVDTKFITLSNFESDSETEQLINSHVLNALLHSVYTEKYPKSSIDVFVKVFNRQSSHSTSFLVNSIVNCSSLAITDAEIEVKDMVVSGFAHFNVSENKTVDLLQGEDVVEVCCNFFNARENEMVGIYSDGNSFLSEESLVKMIQVCAERSIETRKVMNGYLLESV